MLSELCAAVESGRAQSGGMARAFRGWALDHPACFRFALGLNDHVADRSAPKPALARLLSLSVRPGSTLCWATLCGLVLLELTCDADDLPDDIDRLYETAAASLGELPGRCLPGACQWRQRAGFAVRNVAFSRANGVIGTLARTRQCAGACARVPARRRLPGRLPPQLAEAR